MGVLPTEELRLPLLKKDMKRIYRAVYPNHTKEQRNAFEVRLNSITAIRNSLEILELKVFGPSWRASRGGRLRSQDSKATNKQNPSAGIVKNDVSCRVNRMLSKLKLKRYVDLLGSSASIPTNARLPYVACDRTNLRPENCVTIDYSFPCNRNDPDCPYIDYSQSC